jgi:hydrogenase-4 component B
VISLLLLSVPLLLIGAVLALVLRGNKERGLAAIGAQAVATGCVLAAVFPTLLGGEPLVATWPWPEPIASIQFRVDGLGAFFLVWSLPMTLLGTVYATGYLAPFFHHGRNGGWHFALLNLTSLSFVLVYSVQNALVFLLGWEIAALSAWLLVIWDYGNQKIRFAGFNYLVSTHIGMFVLVAAFMLLHAKTNSMDFAAFGTCLASPGPMRDTVFLLLGISFALKSAFFPFHTWLPRAHSAAPAHVSALMSGVIHKAGLFGFLRFLLLAGKPDERLGWAVLGFGALSAFFGVLYAATQRDLKRLLGYSSTENVGIAAMGFGIGCLGWTWGVAELTLLGFAGGLLHVFNHALFKCLLFYAAGAIYRATHTVDLERLGGLAKRLPRVTMLFLVGALAITALPPLNGFISEFLIYAGLLGGHAPTHEAGIVLVAAAAAMAFIGGVSALAMVRAFGLTFLGVPRDANIHVRPECTGPMLAPMVLHAAGAIVIGLAPEVGVSALEATLRLFPIGSDLSAVHVVLAPVVWIGRILAVVLLGTCVLKWRRGRAARSSVTWACGYTVASPRLQYTGSSFAEQLLRVFASFVSVLRREQLPNGPFPQQPGHVGTHVADAVERRLFEVLGQGEELVTQASDRVSEQPRLQFAAGFVVLLVIGAIVAGVFAS